MSDEPQDVVEGTVHDEPPRAELAVRDRTAEVLRPVNADDLLDSFHAYQELLPKLLVDSDYQVAERGKRFVKKSGWRKIARAFRLNVEVLQLQVDRDDQGLPVRATAIARATAPNGDFSDGDGHCSIQESRFRNQQARAKAENDLPATAVTRAKNRAISDLVGMGEVSADEIGAYSHATSNLAPDWTRDATNDEQKAAGAAIAALLGPERARALWSAVALELNVQKARMPFGVAYALQLLAEGTATVMREGGVNAGTSEPDLPWGPLPGDPPDEPDPSLLDPEEGAS